MVKGRRYHGDMTEARTPEELEQDDLPPIEFDQELDDPAAPMPRPDAPDQMYSGAESHSVEAGVAGLSLIHI